MPYFSGIISPPSPDFIIISLTVRKKFDANIQEKFSQLPNSTTTINDRLSYANIHHWKPQPAKTQLTTSLIIHTIPPLPLNIALPKFVIYPNSQAYCVKYGIPGSGLMYYKDILIEPNVFRRELLMGFQSGSIFAPGLTETQRWYLLGQIFDVNIIFWLLKQSLLHTQNQNLIHMIPHTQVQTIAIGLPLLRQIHNLTLAPTSTPPHPTIWKPLHNPSEWIYRDGSLKTGKPRLGASVIHSPTSTTTYIDASGLEETHTIMRAELVAISSPSTNTKMTNG